MNIMQAISKRYPKKVPTESGGEIPTCGKRLLTLFKPFRRKVSKVSNDDQINILLTEMLHDNLRE